MAEVDREALARLLGAMAHPLRVGVLLHLEAHGPCDVACLQEALDAEQSALSHQLRVLRRAQLVVAEPQGRRRLYRVADAHIARIVRDAADHLAC